MNTLLRVLLMAVICSGLLACYLYAFGTMTDRRRFFIWAAIGIILVGMITSPLLAVLGILPVRYIEIVDYCANWGGKPGVCTEHHLEVFAMEHGFERCEIGYTGPHPSSIRCLEYWPGQ